MQPMQQTNANTPTYATNAGRAGGRAGGTNAGGRAGEGARRQSVHSRGVASNLIVLITICWSNSLVPCRICFEKPVTVQRHDMQIQSNLDSLMQI